jgi:hypothetical protein
MKALVLGCSHAEGSEMGTDEYGRSNSYPMLLAERMGYTADNRAIGGGSNDAMFRIFESEHINYDLVIACWTGHNRTEVWNRDKWIPFAPGGNVGELDAYHQQWVVHHTDDVTGRLNKIKNIMALNAMAQTHNVSVINIDSFWPVYGYTWPSNIHWPVSIDFWDWANAQGYTRTPWGHFARDAHSAFADYILAN